MDQLLFYHYLNYQKEHNPSLAKRLSLLPKVACVLFFVTIACAIVGIVWLFRGATAKALIAVGIELASSEIFYHYMELYKIKTSKQRLIQRIDYWYDLRNWLKENSIQGYAAIETIPAYLPDKKLSYFYRCKYILTYIHLTHIFTDISLSSTPCSSDYSPNICRSTH